MNFSTFNNKYKIEGKLRVLTALHIGSGREEFGHDAPFMKMNGEYYIPGSSFRGYLRTKLERLLEKGNDFGLYVEGKKLDMTDVKLIFGFTNVSYHSNATEEEKYECKKIEEALSCQATSFSGRIHIADMPILSDVSSVTRDGIAIDRETGATETGAKFDYDVIPAGSEFAFRMELENIEEYQVELLILALQDIMTEGDLFGGKLSRGIGKCQIQLEKIKYVDQNNLQDYIFSRKMQVKSVEEFVTLRTLSLRVE